MKIVHVVRSLLRNSGVGVFVAELASAQVRALHRAAIFCRWHPECGADEKVDYRTDPQLLAFRDSCNEKMVAHIHALWDVYPLRALWYCRRRGIPFVVSPHGCLMPRVFQHGRIKKWVFWHFFLKPLVRRAAAIHCTSGAEKDAVEQLLGKRCPPVVIAPLGVHLPDLRERPKSSVKTVLFLGRLGEEKGLVKLLDAWNQVRREGWQLVIAGPSWEGHQKVLLDHCRSLHLPYDSSSSSSSSSDSSSDSSSSSSSSSTVHSSSVVLTKEEAFKHPNLQTPPASLDLDLQPRPISFPGPVDGDAKDALYRSADIFVLPSPMENFSHVVVEALAYGLPVIATKGTPWNELESERCGRWIDQGVEPLAAALRELMAMSDDERAAMGANGRNLVAEKYQWNKVAANLEMTYQSCIKGMADENEHL